MKAFLCLLILCTMGIAGGTAYQEFRADFECAPEKSAITDWPLYINDFGVHVKGFGGTFSVTDVRGLGTDSGAVSFGERSLLPDTAECPSDEIGGIEVTWYPASSYFALDVMTIDGDAPPKVYGIWSTSSGDKPYLLSDLTGNTDKGKTTGFNYASSRTDLVGFRVLYGAVDNIHVFRSR